MTAGPSRQVKLLPILNHSPSGFKLHGDIYELIIELFKTVPGGASNTESTNGELIGRVYISPPTAKELWIRIGDYVRDYEENIGQIPVSKDGPGQPLARST